MEKVREGRQSQRLEKEGREEGKRECGGVRVRVAIYIWAMIIGFFGSYYFRRWTL